MSCISGRDQSRIGRTTKFGRSEGFPGGQEGERRLRRQWFQAFLGQNRDRHEGRESCADRS